jgi:hypothetical protein
MMRLSAAYRALGFFTRKGAKARGCRLRSYEK